MSVVNWGEVYYSTWRAHGPGVARKIFEDISQLAIDIVDADLELTRLAAELRADHELPYTGCFAAALAADRKASLATSEKEFATVEKKDRHSLDQRLAKHRPHDPLLARGLGPSQASP